MRSSFITLCTALSMSLMKEVDLFIGPFLFYFLLFAQMKNAQISGFLFYFICEIEYLGRFNFQYKANDSFGMRLNHYCMLSS